MSEQQMHFDFNTAITAVEEKGRFNDDKHREKILPLRERVMNIDGVTGMFVARYAVKVDFLPEVISADDLETAVITAVTKVANDEKLGLFPLRGNKTPEATRERPTPRVNNNVKVVARFNSDLVRYPVSTTDRGRYDAEAYAVMTQDLAEALVDIDGVRAHKVELRFVSLTFDKRVTDTSTIEKHISKVVREFASRDKFFPSLGSESSLVITFEQVDTY